MTPPAPAKIRVFIVDDSPIVRRGLIAVMEEDEQAPRIEVVGEAGTVAQAIQSIRALRPDLALIDVRLPDGLGLAVCEAIEAEHMPVQRLVITSYSNDEYVRDAIAAGALGYVLKDVDPTSLLAAVRTCATGQSALDQETIGRVVRFLQAESRREPSVVDQLSAQERKVLELVAAGRTNSEAAALLGLSPHTVKNHLAKIFDKLGVGNRAEAVAFLLRNEQAP